MKAPRRSQSVALCGVLGALAVALMLLGAVIPLAMFIAPAVDGLLVLVACEECGRTMAWTMYAAVSILSVLFVPDKEVALIFVFLLGYYPLLKDQLDRIPRRALRVLLKNLLYYAAIFSMYGLLLVLFPADGFSQEAAAAGLALAAATVVMGNIAFLLFDQTLANLLRLYRLKWQPRLRRMLGR